MLINITLNQNELEWEIKPHQTLLDVLRNKNIFKC